MPARARLRAYWQPKAGNSPDEYEDAYFSSHADLVTGGKFRCAVSDGATESSFSGLWAELLVCRWCRQRDLSWRGLERSLAPLQETWRSKVASEPLPWYAEEKVRSGAFASLLGVQLNLGRCDHASWSALAVGDTCLFHVREGEILRSFPLSRPDEFHRSPVLISSIQAHNGGVGAVARRAAGVCRLGDRLHLMTDALACWFLSAGAWLLDEAIADTEGATDSFERLVSEQRAAGAMRNDDVTLLTVQIT